MSAYLRSGGVETDLQKHGLDIADDPGGLGVDAASDPIVERLRRVGAIVGPTTYFGFLCRHRETGVQDRSGGTE